MLVKRNFFLDFLMENYFKGALQIKAKPQRAPHNPEGRFLFRHESSRLQARTCAATRAHTPPGYQAADPLQVNPLPQRRARQIRQQPFREEQQLQLEQPLRLHKQRTSAATLLGKSGLNKHFQAEDQKQSIQEIGQSESGQPECGAFFGRHKAH